MHMLRTAFQIALKIGTYAWDLLKSPEGRLEKYSNNQLFEELLDDNKFILIGPIGERIQQLGIKNAQYWIHERVFEGFVTPLLEEAKRAVHTGKANGFEIRPNYQKYTLGDSFIHVGDFKAIALQRIKNQAIDSNVIRALGIAIHLGTQVDESQLKVMNGQRFYKNAVAHPS